MFYHRSGKNLYLFFKDFLHVEVRKTENTLFSLEKYGNVLIFRLWKLKISLSGDKKYNRELLYTLNYINYCNY